MIAGTLAQLDEPADDILESALTTGTPGKLPALYVEESQTLLEGEQVIQGGSAAGRVKDTRSEIAIPTDQDGNPTTIDVDREDTKRQMATDWVADVRKTGIIAAESTGDEEPYPFPFDLVAAQTNRSVQLLQFDIAEMYSAWKRDDALLEVWMRGAEFGDGTTIEYHQEAGNDTPNVGLGFSATHGGVVLSGVIYKSGYLALHNSGSPVQFIQFVEERILPYALSADDEESDQSTLDDVGPSECDECGRETDSIEEHGDEELCVVCHNKRVEETEEYAEAAAGGDD